MSQKERLQNQLANARQMSERLLSDFQTPQDWIFQVHEGANHALWIAGHIAHADNFFISLLDPAKAVQKEGFAEKFGMGSQPANNPDAYPPADDVLTYLRERRQVLLDILSGLDEQDFSNPTPEGTPDFLPDFASVFEIAVWHEGVHSGQLTVSRRALGHQPVFGAQPAETH